MSTASIAVAHVTKRYGALTAVDDVSIEVRPGEVYALLGLNGAGKTTLIRLLLGMIRPTRGSVAILGRQASDPVIWTDVGYLVEGPSAYPELTVRENLEVCRRLRRLPDRSVVEDAIDQFTLGAYADRKAGTLSLGNAQRLGLAKAMMHRPSLLLLDEPVNGLDPAGVIEVRDLIVDSARDEGVAVLLSSHLLSEVARTATRIGVLHDGRLVDEFRAEDVPSRVHRHLEVGARDLAAAATALQSASFDTTMTGHLLVLQGTRALAEPEVVARVLVDAGQPPTRLAVVEEDLESLFMRLVGLPTPMDAGPDDEQ
jgi:ABC-2 type transport system ATP-binding protein